MKTEAESILSDPRFRQLVHERSQFAWVLSAVMLAIYFGFILLVAFGKEFLATRIGDGVTTLGILIGLAVIVSAFVLTGIYVVRANGRFDSLTRTLMEDR